MVVQTGTGRSRGAFAIMDEPEYEPSLPSSKDGRAPGVSDRIVFMLTGAQDGVISVETHALTGPPQQRETGWEEVFDAEVQSRTGLYFWACLGSEVWESISKPLSTQGPGRYRVRIHVRGRLQNVGWYDNQVDESYLIQVWATGAKPATGP